MRVLSSLTLTETPVSYHSTSWEFPELTSGKQTMISDCDGRHYPWYGSRNETVIFKGPCDRYQTATVYMNDNFHPHVTWRNPANRHQLEPNLTHIIRDQSFYVWLVAWNMVTMKSFVMQVSEWLICGVATSSLSVYFVFANILHLGISQRM